MNPKRVLTSFFLVIVGYSVAFSQYSSAEAVKTLKRVSEDLTKASQKWNEPNEAYVESAAKATRSVAIDLQKGLNLTSVTTEIPSLAELPADSRGNIVRSLVKLVNDLLKEPIPESAETLDDKQAAKLAFRLNAMLQFTEPKLFESRKSYPLSSSDLVNTFAQPNLSIDVMGEQALNLVRKRCVDFVLDETTTWALKMVGASDAVIGNVDSCISPVQRAAITDRNAAKPISAKMSDDAALISDLFRALFSKKDIENRKRSIEVGREFLRRFENYEDARELTDYLKTMLPKIEAKVAADERTRNR